MFALRARHALSEGFAYALQSMRRFVLMIVALTAMMAAANAQTGLRGLITAEALQAKLSADSLIVVDIRSGETRAAGATLFAAGHIPGAVHADYAYASWRLPRGNISAYLPEPAQFEALASELGISNEHDVVIVHEGEDASSFGAAARVYWTFKAMGHASVAILDGGYRAWREDATRPIAKGATGVTPTIYEAKPNPDLRAHLAEVQAAAAGKGAILIDSRPESFFSGREKLKAIEDAGHIAHARNIPHHEAIGADFRVKDLASLRASFASAKGGPVITYCNTGHWAATDWFVLSELLDQPSVKLYDGSMLEFSGEKAGPILRSRSGS